MSVQTVGTTLSAAIVGAGPSGFYAAEHLLRAGFAVDLLEALPTPFGLVRAGVAPDHPKIKSVSRIFEKTAQHPAFRYFGGVEVGVHLAREDLLERYDAVVYAVGTPGGNRLGIPGEDLAGVWAATDFVGWYNGHPAHADHAFDLSARGAVVIGNGNVAIDVARMLVLDPAELRRTDTADHAIAALSGAGVRDVTLLGRRGPAQAAFTNPELLELGELARADVVVDPGQLALDAHTAALPAAGTTDKTTRRNVEILREYAAREPAGRSHRVHLRFLRSPLEVLGDEHGHVTGLRVAVNRMEQAPGGGLRAVPTGAEETIACGLVLRSIGYRGQPVAGVPFDDGRGLIRNRDGRIVDEEGAVAPREYVAGWIKRGPSGVIGTNKRCAADTVARIVEDRDAGRLGSASRADRAGADAWLRERAPALVTWEGWGAIDGYETGLGRPHGRPRVKLVRVGEMHAIAGAVAS